MDSDEFFKFGVSLIDQDAPEVNLRTGASRIYYSVFHMAKVSADNYCSNLISSDEKGRGAHARIIKRLSDNSKYKKCDRSLLAIATILKNARKIRSDADYELDLVFTYRQAREIQAFYTRVKSEITRLLSVEVTVTPPDSPASPSS